MSGIFTRESLRFLYRSDEGEIGRATWWGGLAPLVILLAILTIIWLVLAPWANRGLDERAFIDPRTLAAYVYLLFYAFAIFLIAVCYTNLSAKRFRARGKPPGLAGLLPLAALLSGAAHWLYPRVADVMPWFLVAGCDLALVAVLVWHVVELGLRD